MMEFNNYSSDFSEEKTKALIDKGMNFFYEYPEQNHFVYSDNELLFVMSLVEEDGLYYISCSNNYKQSYLPYED